MKATPVFVLGIQRSGTTWLANQLAGHSDIAGITAPEHYGTHESSYFDRVYGRYGDLSDKSNFIEFVEIVSAMDFFVLAGASKEFLYSLYPTTYEGVFRIVMDRYTERQGKRYWVEKSPGHTLLAHEIARFYSDAKFIGIIRDVQSQIASLRTLHITRTEGMSNEPKLKYRLRILWNVLRWNYFHKFLNTFGKNNPNTLIIQYSDIRENNAEQLTRICQFLGLEFEEEMLQERFRRDTSFKGNIQRDTALTPFEKQLISIVALLVRIIPLGIMKLPYGIFKGSNKNKKSLPYYFFKITRNTDSQGTLYSTTTDSNEMRVSEYN